jgi:hypothetical protein
MGTSLNGLTPASTYQGLIKTTDNAAISGTAKFLSDGLGNDSVLALSTARVGVGTASPAAILDARTTVGSVFLNLQGTNETNNGESATIRLWGTQFNTANRHSEIANVTSGTTASNNLVFRTNGVEALRITAAGNVGIGTSSPVFRLDAVAAEAGTYTTSTQQVVARIFNNPSDLGSGVNSAFLSIQTTPNGQAHNPIARIGVVAETYGSNNASFVVATRDVSGISEKIRVLSSGGITFNGDTAAANALDDYEEGTWTPSDGSGAGLTYTQVSGTYTKIGREVFVRGFIQFPATADGNQAIVGGLPFTTSSSLGGREGNISYVDKTTISYILSNTSATTFSCWSSAGLSVTNASMSGAFFYFSINYIV